MELCIHSGTPLFATPQYVGSPIVEDETQARFHRLIDDVFARNYFTNNGPLLQRLEEEVAKRHKVRHAVIVSNATLAQVLVLRAMKLNQGEAIVAGNTFVATPHGCAWEGMRIRYADLQPETLNMDPDDVERKIGPETKAIIPTHIFGVFADMKRLRDIANRHDVALLADAAHCFDCDQAGVMAGGFGVAEWISFHATKFFSTVEGGAIVTNDDALARELKLLRDFGRIAPGPYSALGLNCKESEIHAAFGLASLPVLEERRQLLGQVRQAYMDVLDGIPGIRVHPVGATGRNNYRYFALLVGPEFGVPRDVLAEVLKRENMILQEYFYPGCQRLEYYRRLDPAMAESLPVTDAMLESILCLPTAFRTVDPIASAKAVAGLVEAVHLKADKVLAWWHSIGRRE